MNIYKRYKIIKEKHKEIKLISQCASDIKNLMTDIANIATTFIKIEEDRSNNKDSNESLDKRYNENMEDLNKAKIKAMNFGINKFGLYIRQNRPEKVVLYISNFCRKNINYLMKLQDKIINKISKYLKE